MVKKTQTIVTTSQPVPVQEIKREELESVVKQVDNVPMKSSEVVDKKKKRTKSTPKVVVVDASEEILKEPQNEVSKIIVEPDVVEKTNASELELDEVDENAEIFEEETVNSAVVSNENKDKKRSRRIVSKEVFYKDFEGFVESFNLFADNLKLEKGFRNQKTLLSKKLKQLQNDSYKLLKIKNLKEDKKPKSENNSGFMKPVKISGNLAEFLHADPNEPITRVHVTKKLCQYIKEKDLQNPQDRREIIPDEKLKNLFNMGNEKLTYYSMQKQIQQHIFKL